MAVAKPMITEVFFFVFCLYTILPKKMSSCKDNPCDVDQVFSTSVPALVTTSFATIYLMAMAAGKFLI